MTMKRKMKQPEFSFIIPAKNEEAYIRDCVQSIRRQKARKEIIVVDSGSDRTASMARKLGCVAIREKRKGPAAARNRGAKRANGSVFVFIDADVRLEKGFTEKIRKKLRYPVVGCVCRLRVYDGNSLRYEAANLTVRLLNKLGIPMTAGSCFVYDAATFRRVGGFNAAFLTNEDHELAGRVAKLGRFAYFGDIVVWTSCRRVARIGTLAAVKTYLKSSLVFFFQRKYLRDYWDE